jgi:hypothetical protein
LRFTEGPEVTVELVNPAADLPPLGASDRVAGHPSPRSAPGCQVLLTLARMMALLPKT